LTDSAAGPPRAGHLPSGSHRSRPPGVQGGL